MIKKVQYLSSLSCDFAIYWRQFLYLILLKELSPMLDLFQHLYEKVYLLENELSFLDWKEFLSWADCLSLLLFLINFWVVYVECVKQDLTKINQVGKLRYFYLNFHNFLLLNRVFSCCSNKPIWGSLVNRTKLDIFFIKIKLLKFSMCVLNCTYFVNIITTSVTTLHSVCIRNLKVSIKDNSSTPLFS
jgi:hypothetical protein